MHRSASRDDLVERGHSVPGTDFPSVYFVVVKILLGQQAVFITDQAVAGDAGGVEFHLDFYILGDGEQCGSHLFDQHFAAFADRVDVGVVAVAFVGKRLHGAVLQISCAKAEHGKEDARFAFCLDEFLQATLVGDPDIEISIGAEDHSVVAALEKILTSRFVGLLDASRSVRRSAGMQACDRVENLAFRLPLG